jgi:hypothetical protein
MSIAVNHTGDVYEIDGLLINQNSAYLNNYFDIIVKQKAGVVITLHKVLAIDNWAALKLGEMYTNSIACNQLFYIIGRSNPIVQDQFIASELEDILF